MQRFREFLALVPTCLAIGVIRLAKLIHPRAMSMGYRLAESHLKPQINYILRRYPYNNGN